MEWTKYTETVHLALAMFVVIISDLLSSLLGLADLSDVRGGLWPSSLTAMTLKTYSLSMVRLLTV